MSLREKFAQLNLHKNECDLDMYVKYIQDGIEVSKKHNRHDELIEWLLLVDAMVRHGWSTIESPYAPQLKEFLSAVFVECPSAQKPFEEQNEIFSSFGKAW